MHTCLAEQADLTGSHCSKQNNWHASTCRGIKRRAPMPCHARPPYKLVPVGSSPQLLPAVVHNTATASLPLAKRRWVGVGRGVGSAGPAVPRGMLTSGYSQSHGQISATARSLFHPDLGHVKFQQHSGGRHQALGVSLDAWQKQRRVVLQCVLQQQTAALQGFKPASRTEGTQVPYKSIPRYQALITDPKFRCSFLIQPMYTLSLGGKHSVSFGYHICEHALHLP